LRRIVKQERTEAEEREIDMLRSRLEEIDNEASSEVGFVAGLSGHLSYETLQTRFTL
jgi:hypothetical protein